MTTKAQQTKQIRDLLYGLVNKSTVALLRHINAEQTMLLNLFLSTPAWDAWRSQTVDEVGRDLDKIIGRNPVTKSTRKQKVNTVDKRITKAVQ